MGKTCEPKAFSFQCMTKFTTIKKKSSLTFQKLKKKKRKKKKKEKFTVDITQANDPMYHLKFFSLFIFCLIDLAISVREVLKSPTITVLLTISPGFLHSSFGKESACNAGGHSLIPGLGRSSGEGISYPLQYSWAFLVDQLVNSPAMWETLV